MIINFSMRNWINVPSGLLMDIGSVARYSTLELLHTAGAPSFLPFQAKWQSAQLAIAK